MAITPAAGYQVDPSNPNGVVPISATPQTPAPQVQTPAASLVNPNAHYFDQSSTASPAITTGSPQQTGANAQNMAQQGQLTDTSTQQPPAPQTSSPPPATGTLQPGAQGEDVQKLQNYLVQMGYLTPDQVSTGAGIYGPQTTAAVAKLQNDLGVQAGSGQGYYGPQTQSALAQKYQGIHTQLQGSQVPDQGGTAREAIAGADAASASATDPVLGAMAGSLAPIMQSLTQVLNNVNNPALGAVSLQQEYNQLSSQYNLPKMQADMMNMTNIMNGTENDIREEVTKAGGFATDSQVQAITASRNKVIMKQYNSLATQYQAAQTNVQNMMQFAQQDQSNSLQRESLTANITQSMASIQNQLLTMGMTMQQHSIDNANKIVTNIGYTGLASQAQGNPSILKSYEQLLGLAPGALSDPATLKQMDTIRQQQLALGQQKVNIQMYTAGMGTGGTTTPIIMNTDGSISTPIDPTTLNRPAWLTGISTINGQQVDLSKVPLMMSSSEMEQYTAANTAAKVDGSTNNIVAPGLGYYIQQSDGSYVLNSALPSTTDTQYHQIQSTIQNAGVFNGSPTVTRKWTLTANSAISSFKDTGIYKVVSNVSPYLNAINAAAKNPGDKSISDFELLDSFVKAAKGGTGQVTADQLGIMFKGASIPAKYNVQTQQFELGGVLSGSQRASLISLANQTYQENLTSYQKGYVDTIHNMQGQGIPSQFWRNLPDFTTLTPVN